MKKRKKGFGTFKAAVRCNQAAKVSLAALLTEKLSKKHTKKFHLGTRASVRANTSKTLTLKLPAAARNSLHKKLESVSLTLTASNSNGKSHTLAAVGRLKRG